MKRPWLPAALVAALMLAACTDSADPTAEFTVPPPPTKTIDNLVTKNVVYGQGAVVKGKKELRADIYRPPGNAPNGGWPAVVYIHGGGFLRGSKNDRSVSRLTKELSLRGFLVMSIDYRLEYDKPKPNSPALSKYFKAQPRYVSDLLGKRLEPSITAAVEDTVQATTWLSTQNQIPVNPNRIALVGDSAGAITAMHTAYLLDDVGIVPPNIRAVGDLWGGFIASPGDASAIDKGEPPLFIAHGMNDSVVPFALGQEAYERAKKVGIPVLFEPKPGVNHGFSAIRLFEDKTSTGKLYIDALADFIHTHSE